jgi:YaiO family outer membrane protein
LTYYRQTDEHRDLVWLGSVAYYADKAIWEAGAHVTRSEPGAAISTTPFVSTRLGDPRRRTFAARVSYGTEAYARLGPTVALIAFRSRALSLAWREAVREDLTLLVQPEYYANPSYARRGLTVGAVWGASR